MAGIVGVPTTVVLVVLSVVYWPEPATELEDRVVVADRPRGEGMSKDVGARRKAEPAGGAAVRKNVKNAGRQRQVPKAKLWKPWVPEDDEVFPGVTVEHFREMSKEERATSRADYRLDLMADMSIRLDEHALDEDWDFETTERVRDHLLTTAERITDLLHESERGAFEWEHIRAAVRQYRLDQATELEAMLGPERFEAFVVGMGFERFFGDEPVRGLL